MLEAANRRGVTPQQHTDELHLRFKNLWARLDVQYDAFVRTTPWWTCAHRSPSTSITPHPVTFSPGSMPRIRMTSL